MGQAEHPWSAVQEAAQTSHPTVDMVETQKVQQMPCGLEPAPSTCEVTVSPPSHTQAKTELAEENHSRAWNGTEMKRLG